MITSIVDAAPPLILENNDYELILRNVSASWQGSNVTLSCSNCNNNDLGTVSMTEQGRFRIPSNGKDGVHVVTVTVVNTCGQTWSNTVEIGMIFLTCDNNSYIPTVGVAITFMVCVFLRPHPPTCMTSRLPLVKF